MTANAYRGRVPPETLAELVRREPVDVLAIQELTPELAQLDDDLPLWRADLRNLPAAAPDAPVQLLAGDFNSTLDDDELRERVGRGHRDAAEATGAGFRPTWQGRRAPPVTIDHVLVPERLGVRDVAVHDLPRSDHRAVVATVILPAR